MEDNRMGRPRARVLIRIALCTLVLGVGAIGMVALASLKEPPAEARHEERPIKVETVTAAPTDVEVVISGFGEARPLDVVDIAAEVSGRVAEVHPRLEPGEIIPEGALLFRIDDSTYRAAVNEVRALVAQRQETIARLRQEYAADRRRLKTLKRTRELAAAEHRRLKTLYEQDDVGTRSGVEKAEQGVNAAADAADLLARSVAVYPTRIEENRAALASAEATLERALADLERTAVHAPFDGRVKQAAIEAGQFVAPGQTALTLADDSVLEIQVPLDSRDARNWLRFDAPDTGGGAAWFTHLTPVTATVQWTDDPEGHRWRGRLHRVVAFDPKTRTLTVAVRVSAENALSGDGLPLVEGMFCRVEIPGKTLRNVYPLPRWAVSFKDTVYLAEADRLKTVPVTVARIEGEEALVSGGLQTGDQVIVTRLVDPLENALLEVLGQSVSDPEPAVPEEDRS